MTWHDSISYHIIILYQIILCDIWLLWLWSWNVWLYNIKLIWGELCFIQGVWHETVAGRDTGQQSSDFHRQVLSDETRSSGQTFVYCTHEWLRRIHSGIFNYHCSSSNSSSISSSKPVVVSSGRSLGGNRRRCPGRPGARWTDQLRNDTGSVPANLWRQTGPWWSDATARAGYAMTTTSSKRGM